MKPMLGGIRIPRVPPAATQQAERDNSYLALLISGMATLPKVAAVAPLSPQMAANPALDASDPSEHLIKRIVQVLAQISGKADEAHAYEQRNHPEKILAHLTQLKRVRCDPTSTYVNLVFSSDLLHFV